MADDATRRKRSHLIPVIIVLAAAAIVLLLRRSTAVQVHYRLWRLDNEVGAAQEYSIKALTALGADAVPGLRRALHSERPATRNGAVKALGKIDAPDARAALADALGNESGEIRTLAIYGLVGTTDPAVLPAIRGALTDRRADVRRMAVFAIAAYPPHVALGEMIDSLKITDESTRSEIVSRLAGMDSATVLPVLFERLRRGSGKLLAPSVQQVVERITGEDPGSEPQAMLDWWAANRSRLLEPEREPIEAGEGDAGN